MNRICPVVPRRWARAALASVAGALVLTMVAGAAISSGAAKAKPVKIAYLSFAVNNSYDAPMLAAAKAAARKAGATTIQVFDANNSPTTQLNQLQTVASSGQYNAIIVQPIFGTGLITTVKQAIASKIKVVNMDQELGPNLGTDKPQVPGLAGNVVFVPTEIGKKLGQLTIKACKAHGLNPCNIGYLYDIQASALDVAIRQAFDGAIAGRSSLSILANGQDFFTPSTGLSAVQTMMQASPSINLIVGSDQGIEGAVQAVDPTKVTLVGYGASAAGLAGVSSGKWFGDVAQLPATEGRDAVQCAVAAVRTGKSCGGIDPVAKLPNGGVVTRSNVKKFRGEWPG